MARSDGTPFFIGYLNRVPRSLALFLAFATTGIFGAMAGLALAIGAGVGDPGDAHFAWDLGRQHLAGTLRLDPYPVLHLPADGATPPRAILLAGQGKRGVAELAAALADASVEAGGVLLQRGDIDMLQVGGPVGLRAAEDDAMAALAGFDPAPPVQLGRWRLAGEICDGKCTQGAMRPGRGLAHKACANLCLIGGTPPVFVSSGEVDGESYFLLADKTGSPLSDAMRDLVALYIEIEGEVERRDNLLVFKVDLASARVL